MSLCVLPTMRCGISRITAGGVAASYVAQVEANDGAALEPAVSALMIAFINGCIADASPKAGVSNWDALSASCLLSGPRTLAGIFTPLKGPAPTNEGFVIGDYNRSLGLAGATSGKRLLANYSSSSSTLDNSAQFIHVSSLGVLLNRIIGSNDATGGSRIRGGASSWMSPRVQSQSTAFDTLSGINASGFLGISRESSTGYNYDILGSSGPVTRASSVASGAENYVYSDGVSPQDCTAQAYGFSKSIDLAAMRTRLTTYMAGLISAGI